jgi:hypothetical protein
MDAKKGQGYKECGKQREDVALCDTLPVDLTYVIESKNKSKKTFQVDEQQVRKWSCAFYSDNIKEQGY